jgi:hypothetical protein
MKHQSTDFSNVFDTSQQTVGVDLLADIFGTSGTNDILMPKQVEDNEDEQIASRVLKNETLDKVLDNAVKKEQEEKNKPKDVTPPAEPEKPAPTNTVVDENAAKSILDNISTELDVNDKQPEQKETPAAGRPKTDKNALASYIVKKIQSDEYGLPDNIEFDASKQKLEDVVNGLPEETLHTILDANWTAKEKALIDQTPKEFFESLPESLQYAAKAVAAGAGEDQLQDIYRALLRVEQVRVLDPKNEEHQPAIIQTYLQATGWEPEAIAEQLEEWKEGNKLAKKAGEFKPKLDDMQKEQVEVQVRIQEQRRAQEEQLAQFYNENIYNTLKGNELAGIKLDKRFTNELMNNMSTTVESPWNGQPVNYLGYGLHMAQFVKPDYEAVLLAAMILNDKAGTLEKLSQRGASLQAEKDVKLVKMGQGLGTGTNTSQQPEQKQPKRINTNNVLKRVTA